MRGKIGRSAYIAAVGAIRCEGMKTLSAVDTRARSIFVCILAVALVGLATSASALADNVVVTPTNVTVANASGTTALGGISVAGYNNPSEPLLVSISTTEGSLALTETSGLTLSYGYSSYSGEELSFIGDQTNVQAALATLTLTGSEATGTADVSMTVTAQESGISYLPLTGHYYKYVAAAEGSFTAARAGAESSEFRGQKGYLASIPSAAVNTFINAHLNGAKNVWAGGKATDYPSGYNSNTGIKRVWRWVGGPLNETIFTECSDLTTECAHANDGSDFFNWNPGEPNNGGYPEAQDPGEHQLEINYLGNGKWNDLANVNTGTSGYVIEYGNLLHGGDFTGVYSTSSNVTLANVPDAPTGVEALGNSFPGSTATVSWVAPLNDGNSPVTKYTVTASPGGAKCLSDALAECTITGLTNGTEYQLSVTATNAVGTGSPSIESIAATVSGAPAGPSGAVAVAGPRHATVSWIPAVDNGAQILGYTVTATPGGATCSTPVATICTVTGLANGTQYTFAVTATNDNGMSVPSPASNAVIPSDIPGAPSGVVAVTGVQQASIYWTAPSDNGSEITGYTVTAEPGGATCSTSGAVGCTIAGLEAGRSYTFAVTARNGDGRGPSSAASNTVFPAGPPAGAPAVIVAAVTPVAACASARSETVHWKVHARQHMRSIVITLNGAVYMRLPGSARSATISLAGRKNETVAVKITGTKKNGRLATSLRTFRLCTAGHSAGSSASAGSPASLYLTSR